MAMAATYTTFAGMVVHQRKNGVDTELISDPLGSVVKTKDASGNETSRTEYWPYGEVQSSTGSNPTPFGFVGTLGYYRDLATRLYVRARYLRPDQGQWQTVDPFWPDESAYGYVYNRPVIGIDMYGQRPDLTFGGLLPPRPQYPKPIGPPRPPRFPWQPGWRRGDPWPLPPPGRPIKRPPFNEDAISDALEACGSNPIGCAIINLNLPPCTASNPNFDKCGEQIIGPGPICANRSSWPSPKPQTKMPGGASMWGADLCCIECQMRVCCAVG